MRIHRTAIQVHSDNIRYQLYLLVIHLSLPVQMRISPLGKYNGVVCFIRNRSIQRLFLLGRSQRIRLQGIPQQGIRPLYPDGTVPSQTERVAPQGVRLLSFGRYGSSPTTLRSSLTGKKK